MKRLIPFLVVAIAAALFLLRDRWLPQGADHQAWLGYVEGETSHAGPAATGRITSIVVKKGDTVKADALLFQLDDSAAQADVTRLAAAVETAKANARDLDTGKRAEELALIARQKAEAEANLDLARLDYTRATNLAKRGVAAENQYDQAKAALAVAEEKVKQADANAAIAQLPAREAERTAALSRVTEAEAALAVAQQKLKDYQAIAASDAIVDDVFFDPGEVVSAGQPVIALLQPGKETLRFYVPEGERAKLSAGVSVTYRCDGCAGGTALITYVAATPEYTPPVIYSESARAKLVFLVEATPQVADPHLQAGLPVEIEPLP